VEVPVRRHYVTRTGKLERAVENRAYLHVMLLEKEPGFLAALELAMDRVDRELSCEGREDVDVRELLYASALAAHSAPPV
jgi:hypothetical protein